MDWKIFLLRRAMYGSKMGKPKKTTEKAAINGCGQEAKFGFHGVAERGTRRMTGEKKVAQGVVVVVSILWIVLARRWKWKMGYTH